MKPWIGVVAVAATIFAVPATALAAPEDPALLKFKLDNSSQYDDFENLGFDMDHAVENGEGDDIIVSAWVDDEQLKRRSRARLRERRRRPQQGELRRDPRREPRQQDGGDRREEGALGERGRPQGRQRRSRVDPRAARRLLREQRRQVPLDRGQRRRRHLHRRRPERLQRPDRDGRVVRRGRQQARRGRPGRRTRTRTSPRTTTSTTTRSSGSATRATPRPRSRRSRSPPATATSTRSPPRNGSRRTRRRTPPTFKSGFVTRYYDSPDAYAKVRALAAEFPNIASVEDLPEKTWGYQRPAATMLGYVNTTATAPERHDAVRAPRRRCAAGRRRRSVGRGPAEPDRRRHVEGHGSLRRQLAHGPPARADRPEPAAGRHASPATRSASPWPPTPTAR